MTIGIIANSTKENVTEVVSSLIKKLKDNGFDFLITDTIIADRDSLTEKINKKYFHPDKNIYRKSDIIVSIGGDGTMLATSYQAQFFDKPVLGINMGKLGFLAEANVDQLDTIIDEIKNNRIEIEERMIICGECIGHKIETLYAINDIVIDRGGWPKMIELTVTVDGEYVTTFGADGIIIATPTGSTGYSISVGGPIVSPNADVITVSPISPHSLNVRPLVLPSNQEIRIKATSLHTEVLVNCDGQRVFAFPPPFEIKVTKSERSLKLVHTTFTSYFETLRNKLMWGIDLRNFKMKK
ncbi:MAG TPA: NAD(+)/NADH kinase [Ignavibacteriaceae bacterium]|nr:NAD(+)/NADH kinase [Ignavibacteriaceae bacterium]